MYERILNRLQQAMKLKAGLGRKAGKGSFADDLALKSIEKHIDDLEQMERHEECSPKKGSKRSFRIRSTS